VDPDSLNQDPDTDPDPAFQVNLDPIRIQGFDDQKLKKKKISDEFFSSKIPIYSCPSYRRNLQPLKVNIQHFKK
jgi:hypothetical protein